MAGKSMLIKEVLRFRRQLFTTEYQNIYYCMPEGPLNTGTQRYIAELKQLCPGLQILEDLPSMELMRSSELPKLFILDDLMQQIFASPVMEQLFTAASHHFSNSIIFTMQNYYSSKKDLTIQRNLTYRIIFQKSGELRYMRSISSQFSTDANFLDKCFALLDEEESPNSGVDNKFVLFDGHPQAPLRQFPVRGMILPRKDGEIRPILFSHI